MFRFIFKQFLLIFAFLHVIAVLVGNVSDIRRYPLVGVIGKSNKKTGLLSFGHQVTGYDYFSRIYFPNKFFLFLISGSRTNKYLHLAFKKNIIFTILNVPSGYFFSDDYEEVLTKTVLASLKFLSVFKRDMQITSQENIYKTIGLMGDGWLAGNEDQDRLIKRKRDYSGYYRLLKEGIGLNPKLPFYIQSQVGKSLQRLDITPREYLLIHLRQKGQKSSRFSESARSPSDFGEYIKFIETVVSHHPQLKIIISGVNSSNLCKPSWASNVFFETELACISGLEASLLNLYLHLNAKIYIGMQSGPWLLARSAGIKCILADCWPLSSAGIVGDKVLYRPHFTTSGRKLKLWDLYENYSDISYGFGYRRQGISLGNVESTEIYEAFSEAISGVEPDLEMARWFNGLRKSDMIGYHQGGVPPACVLAKEYSDYQAMHIE